MVLYAGTLGAINGVGYVPQIAKVALEANSQLRFVVVGDGAELDKVVSEAERSGGFGPKFLHPSPSTKKGGADCNSQRRYCALPVCGFQAYVGQFGKQIF